MKAPDACFFPYIDITPLRLTRALLFFRQIILYQPPGDQPEDYLSFAVEKGFLRLIKADFFKDESEFSRIMSQLSGWADIYRDPDYLSMLKHRSLNTGSEESGARLMTDIRGRWSDPAAERHPAKEAQVFLSLARRMDKQKGEVKELLAEVEKKQIALSDLMGVEKQASALEDDTRKSLAGGPRLSALEEHSAELMPLRLAAWAHFHAEYGEPHQCLLTDQPDAAAQLDLNLAKSWPAHEPPSGRNTDVLEPLINISLAGPSGPLPWDEIEARRLDIPGWFEFVERVSSRPWKTEELPGLREEAAELAAAVTSGAAEKDEGENISLTGYLIPGTDCKQAYLAAAGLSSGPVPTGVYSGLIFELKTSATEY